MLKLVFLGKRSRSLLLFFLFSPFFLLIKIYTVAFYTVFLPNIFWLYILWWSEEHMMQYSSFALVDRQNIIISSIIFYLFTHEEFGLQLQLVSNIFLHTVLGGASPSCLTHFYYFCQMLYFSIFFYLIFPFSGFRCFNSEKSP